jgi:hypothetical protein
MTRPLTVFTLLMACGSGLYLYQSKHEVQLLDRSIERTVHETNALREQSRLLATEWTMLNDPERLRQFSDTYLSLKTITPSQFTSLADLDNRLPMVPAENPTGDTGEPGSVPLAVEPAAPIVIEPAAAQVAAEALPVPPLPAPQPVPAVTYVARAAEPGAPDRGLVSRPVVAEVQARPVADWRPSDPRPSDPRPSDPRPSESRSSEPRSSEPRPAARVVDPRNDFRVPVAPPRPIAVASPRPSPVNPAANPPASPRAYASSAPVPASVSSVAAMPAPQGPTNSPQGPYNVPQGPYNAPQGPFNGSLLGMSRGSMPPSPRPMPVIANY